MTSLDTTVLGLELLEATPPLRGDIRFLNRYFLPDRARYAREVFLGALCETEAGAAAGAFDALLRRGRLRRILGQPGQALTDLAAALAQRPKDPWALAFEAELRLAREPGPAAEQLGLAIAQDASQGPFFLWRGYASFLLEDWDAAEQDLGVAAARSPDLVAAWLLRGILRERRGETAPAEQDIDAAISLDPAAAGLYTMRAGIRARAARWDAALEDAHRAISLHPENLDGFLRVLFRMEDLGRPDAATEKALLVEVLTRKTRESPQAAWLFALKAEAEKRVGFFRHEESTADLERAVALEPGRAWLRAFLGRAVTSFHRTGALADRGLAELEEACRLAPDCGWIRAWRAEIVKNMGREDEALADLDAAAALDPNYRLTHAWRGELRLRRGDAAGAAADFSWALDVRPDNSWTLHQRAAALRAQGRVLDALRDMKQAVDRHPKYVVLHLGLKDASARSILGLVLRAFRLEEPKGPEGGSGEEKAIDRIVRDVWGESLEKSVLAGEQEGSGSVTGKGSFEQLMALEPLTIAELDGVLRASPQEPLAFLWRGRTRLNAGDAAAALPDLERAVQLEPNGLAEGWRAEALLGLGRMKEAEAAFSKSLALGGTSAASAFAWRASLRAARGDGAGCFADLLTASRRDPTQAKLYQSWARLLAEVFTAAFPTDDKSWRRDAAELALRADDLSSARRSLDQAGSAVKDARLSILKGLVQGQAGDAKGCSRELAAAVSIDAEGTAEALETLKTELVQLKEETLAMVWRALADAYAGLEDWAAAQEACRRYLELRPEDAEGYRLRAGVRRRAGDLDAALQDMEKLAALEPGAGTFAERGELKRRLYDFAGGREDGTRAIDADPGRSEGYTVRAECRRGAGDFAGAIEDAGAALARFPSQPWPYVVRAKAERFSGKFSEALADVDKAAALDARSAKARAWRGEILRKLGKPAEALAAMDAAVALDARAAWFYAVRAELRRELGDPRGALEDLGRAVMDPRFSAAYDFLGAEPASVRSDPSLAWVYGLRAGARRNSGDIQGALSDLDHALALDPACFWARAWRGEARLQAEAFEGAAADLGEVLGNVPDYVEAHVWLGQALLGQRRFHEAIERYDKALSLDASRVLAWVGRALAHKELGELSRSVSDFEKARALAPELFETAAA